MAGTQPYTSPDLEAGNTKDPDLQPVTPDAGDALTRDTAGPRSTVAPGADSLKAGGSGGSGSSGGQKEAREIDSDDPRTGEQKRIEDEDTEDESVDDSLDDSFPASDPPSHSTPGKSSQA